MRRVTVPDILKRKGRRKLAMLTCYDFAFAQVLDSADLDMILVGDSMANVVLGMDETRTISFAEMLNHTQAVARAVKRALVIADMPYVSYQKNPAKCVDYAQKFIRAGAQAVKIEWFDKCLEAAKKLIKRKIPVMGHIGLTPQTAHLLGGYKVQGRTKDAAAVLLAQAKSLQALGVFCIVLECVPAQVSRLITQTLKIPTIGIGAGKHCDGQVLVLYDMLGLYKRITPRFVRTYADLAGQARQAVMAYSAEVRSGDFPTAKESYFMEQDQWIQLANRHLTAKKS